MSGFGAKTKKRKRKTTNLDHPLEPRNGSGAREEPAQLGVGRHGRLDEDFRPGAFGRHVDAGGEVQRGRLEGLLAQDLWVVRGGDGVQVDDAEAAGVLVLVDDPLADGAEVVAQVQRPGGLDAREHDLLALRRRRRRVGIGGSRRRQRAAPRVARRAPQRRRRRERRAARRGGGRLRDPQRHEQTEAGRPGHVVGFLGGAGKGGRVSWVRRELADALRTAGWGERLYRRLATSR